MTWKGAIRREYEETRGRFSDMSYKDFVKGEWFASFTALILSNYTKRVDASYIRRKYPGLKTDHQASKAITLAARNSGIVGGLTATAVSAAELSRRSGSGLES